MRRIGKARAYRRQLAKANRELVIVSSAAYRTRQWRDRVLGQLVEARETRTSLERELAGNYDVVVTVTDETDAVEPKDVAPVARAEATSPVDCLRNLDLNRLGPFLGLAGIGAAYVHLVVLTIVDARTGDSAHSLSSLAWLLVSALVGVAVVAVVDIVNNVYHWRRDQRPLLKGKAPKVSTPAEAEAELARHGEVERDLEAQIGHIAAMRDVVNSDVKRLKKVRKREQKKLSKLEAEKLKEQQARDDARRNERARAVAIGMLEARDPSFARRREIAEFDAMLTAHGPGEGACIIEETGK